MRRIGRHVLPAKVLENPPGARGRHRNEHETAFAGAAINAVEHEQVKVHVEIQCAAEALYQGHRTGRRARARQAGLPDQVA